MSTDQFRLWQLISALSPVGAFHHSQALEEAVAAGLVVDETTTLDWIRGLLGHTITNLDLPVVVRAHSAWRSGDLAALSHWNAHCRACRETSELRAEERNMGTALLALLGALDEPVPDLALGYPAAFGVAAANASLDATDALKGYAWAWCENQTACAVKLVPLGHSAGQRILRRLGASLDAAVGAASLVGDDDVGLATPGLAILSAQHEVRHTRLFRS